MIDRQHVWVGPDATSFQASCEACQAHRGGWATSYDRCVAVDDGVIAGTLRPDADVGFTTCKRGHRVVVRRVGRALAAVS